ncbi:hypothetical protein PsYK624_089640 [Phanerochaete sordida]|uniref:Uncharacterized protein n=1 Tax=Phanerochaete sordida TaxID=48140 RepID=A0A9P3GDN4_9APHY|nr:hypothetical protein PsYK624_089640 [Phanerochaete sordida]
MLASFEQGTSSAIAENLLLLTTLWVPTRPAPDTGVISRTCHPLVRPSCPRARPCALRRHTQNATEATGRLQSTNPRNDRRTADPAQIAHIEQQSAAATSGQRTGTLCAGGSGSQDALREIAFRARRAVAELICAPALSVPRS